MHNHLSYKIFTGSCLLGLLVIVTTAAWAENKNYWAGSYYTPKTMNNSSGSRATNPWRLPDKQEDPSVIWPSSKGRYELYQGDDRQFSDNQTPYYQSPGYSAQDDRVNGSQNWGQQQNTGNQRERYITPDIIDSLNSLATEGNSLELGDEENGLLSAPLYQQHMLEYSDYPAYGLGGINPNYDVPAISPWDNAPDVLYRGEEFPWIPDEAIGGVSPMHVPMFGGNSGLRGVDGPGDRDAVNVFNPFSFLQKGD